MRILVAEDDPIYRKLLISHLTKWGHEVIATSDGTEAWQTLQNDDSPLIAILDWMMPGMDGVEVCWKVRRHKRKNTYIILATAKTRKDSIRVGLKAGADDYITKPYEPKELQMSVETGMRALEKQMSDNDQSGASHGAEILQEELDRESD